MIGMNGVFHVVAAIAFIAMGFALLRLQRQRDFLRQALLSAGAQRRRRLFHGRSEAFLAQFAKAAGIPVVQTERLVDCESNAVVVDNEVGCRKAMRLLVDLGHRRIGFIGADPALFERIGPRPLSIEEERFNPYREALANVGVSLDPALLKLGRG